MTTLNELKDTLYSTHYIDVQNQYKEYNVKALFDDYIDKRYASRFASIDVRIKEFILNQWLTSESHKLCYMSMQQKMAMLYHDGNLIRIINNSAEIFKTALDKVSGKVSMEQQAYAQTLLQDIQNAMPLVAEFNRDMAQHELSEAIVEANYILGVSNNYSIRMHDALQYEGKR